MFQLTEKESDIMVSQNAIPSKQSLGGSLPYVFTEHGLLHLANVLRSSRATQMSITIIETFVSIKTVKCKFSEAKRHFKLAKSKRHEIRRCSIDGRS